MKILATDLDRTLLPNGSWEPDEEAIGLFNNSQRSTTCSSFTSPGGTSR